MATLTPTLTLASTDTTSDELKFTVTDELGVKAPSQDTLEQQMAQQQQ